MDSRTILVLGLLLSGCAISPKRSLLNEYRQPPPPLSSSVEIRRGIEVNKTKAKEIQIVTRDVIHTVTEIQEKVPEDIRLELQGVKSRLEVSLKTIEELETNNESLISQIAFKDANEIQLRDWGINQQNESIANANGWIEADRKANKLEFSNLLLKDENKRKSLLITGLFSSALFFVGLRFTKFTIWQTYLYPFGGALAGWFFSRFVL